MNDSLPGEKILKILLSVGLFLLVALIFSQQISFTSLDLGRHLENGRVVWQNPPVLFTNFYSYTEPNFPFINHHWLAGVIFYGLYLLGGFKLLSVFNILLALAIFGLAWFLARRESVFYVASFLSLPVIFLLSERTDIRPELLSYLFILLTWLIIERTRADHAYRRLLWLAPLFLIWVNCHIYWFLGLALVAWAAAADFLPAFFKNAADLKTRWQSGWRAAQNWIKYLLLLAAVCLLNPNTWRGWLYPFNIFQNYGYDIAENKTIFYLSHLMIDYNFIIVKGLLVLLVVTWVLDIWLSRKLRLFPAGLTLMFAGLGLFATRNISLFGLAALVLISGNLVSLKNYWSARTAALELSSFAYWRYATAGALGLFIIASGVYLVSNFSSQQDFIHNSFGLGVAGSGAESAQFFTSHGLSGPVFNNYDIGSALIFWLYPRTKVFVDNRPEAYSAKFFTDIYKPMQTDPAVWQKVSAQYKFKTIYFAYTDSTPWAQQFVSYILRDQDWALVYFDESTIILVNKKLNDPTLVQSLSLTDSAFQMRLNALAAASDLRGRFNLAALAEQAGETGLAQAIYQHILWEFPDNRQALGALGSLLAAQADEIDLRAALTYFNLARRAGYELPGLYDQMGLVYWQLGNYQSAEDNWRAALKLDRQDASALYYLGQVNDLRQAGKLGAE
jgi:hypothetical protein